MQSAAPHEVNVISGKAIDTWPLNLPKSAHLARPPVRVLRRPAGSTRASLDATLLFGALHPRVPRLSAPLMPSTFAILFSVFLRLNNLIGISGH